MRIFILYLVLLLTIPRFAYSQYKSDLLLKEIFQADTNDILQKIIQQPEHYRIQIIYTQINRDAGNRPSFRNFYFHVNKDLYYYPASTVKLPLALLSLEKLNRIHRKGLNKFTRMEYDSSYSGEKTLFTDSSSETGYPSIAQFIRKAFLISDNDAYNRMYEFVGQEEINRSLHSKGFVNTRIVRQFLPMNESENRHTNQIRFLDSSGNLIYCQPPANNRDSFKFLPITKIGDGYLDSHDSLIREPMDFTRHNRIPLEDLQRLLQTALFPKSVPESERFKLKNSDYLFLYKYLSQYPSETSYPKYDTSEFFDSYVKFFFQKGGRQIPENIRVFNKVGWAYGFLTDVSYIVDFKNKIEFMLSATIYTNEDGILNDNKYEYDSIGLPFLFRVEQDVYHFDLNRKRKFQPDLRVFQLKYDHRDPADKRSSIKDVDN
jgi:Beta-lactamase enzyme family